MTNPSRHSDEPNTSPRWAAGFAFVALIVASGCGRDVHPQHRTVTAPPASVTAASASSAVPASSSVAEEAPPATAPYPLGRWRAVDFSELLRVTLALSHILIRHRDSVPDLVSLNLIGWRSPTPSSTRTRVEALRLAEHLAERATRDPAGFAALAEQHSEDLVTRSDGGSLGSVTATQLRTWPLLLDALAATPVGATTRVVETEFGFHVFYRRAPESPLVLSGERIVIGHVDAPFLAFTARRGPPTRSRTEALALARRIYEQARAQPKDFERLVAAYTDHEDFTRGGDLGTWATDQPSFLSREVSTLRRLSLGDIAPPLDTAFGFQIIRRTPNRPREHYGMTSIEVRFDPELPEREPGSRAAALERIRRMSAEIAKAPARFESFQSDLCCTPVLRAVQGRESPVVENTLARLRVGEIALEPVESSHRFLLIQRVPLSRAPRVESTLFELPAPNTVDMAAVMRRFPREFLTAQFRAIGQRARDLVATSAASDASRGAAFAELHERWAGTHPDTEQGRIQALLDLDAKVRRFFTAQKYARYRVIVREHFLDVLINDT